jgi:hypothetical protein
VVWSLKITVFGLAVTHEPSAIAESRFGVQPSFKFQPRIKTSDEAAARLIQGPQHTESGY